MYSVFLQSTYLSYRRGDTVSFHFLELIVGTRSRRRLSLDEWMDEWMMAQPISARAAYKVIISPPYLIIEPLNLSAMIRTGRVFLTSLLNTDRTQHAPPPSDSLLSSISILLCNFLLLLILLSDPSDCECRCSFRRNVTMSQRQVVHTDSLESPDPDHEAPKKAKSRRPASKTTFLVLSVTFDPPILIQILTFLDTAFRQQRLKAWQYETPPLSCPTASSFTNFHSTDLS